MTNVSNKNYRGNQNKHFVINNFFSKIFSFMGCEKKYCSAG